MRDPKISPEAGDVLYAAEGRALVTVTHADGEYVGYTFRGIGLRDEQQYHITIAEWRTLAARTATVDRDTVIDDLEKSRAALVATHAMRLADIDARLSFLRGGQ